MNLDGFRNYFLYVTRHNRTESTKNNHDYFVHWMTFTNIKVLGIPDELMI